MVSVEVLLALGALAQARNFGVLFWKLVVIGQLFPFLYEALCIDDNVLLAVNKQDAAETVRLARVVYEARLVSCNSRVDYLAVVYPEQIAADTLCLVELNRSLT